VSRNFEYYWAKLFKKLRGSAILSSEIHTTSKIESGSLLVKVLMDRHSFCGYDCEIINARIGSFCSIANRVIIGGANHPMAWLSTSPVFYAGRDSVTAKFSLHHRPPDSQTIIGHDVWIGSNVIIKQGINIGTGSVIGMGSIVTKDVLPYSVVAGNPAKLLRPRFDKELAERLLDSEWWNLNDNQLNELGPFIKDPVEFLKKISK
jgi:acetyltransferase-like isoleucine patch superfamily enzyme